MESFFFWKIPRNRVFFLNFLLALIRYWLRWMTPWRFSAKINKSINESPVPKNTIFLKDWRWSQTSLCSINEMDLHLASEDKPTTPQESTSPPEEQAFQKHKRCKNIQPDFNWKVRLWVSLDSSTSTFLSAAEENVPNENQNLSSTSSLCMQLSWNIRLNGIGSKRLLLFISLKLVAWIENRKVLI